MGGMTTFSTQRCDGLQHSVNIRNTKTKETLRIVPVKGVSAVVCELALKLLPKKKSQWCLGGWRHSDFLAVFPPSSVISRCDSALPAYWKHNELKHFKERSVHKVF